MNITPKQALFNLYAASRLAPAVADDHDVLKASREILQQILDELEKQNREDREAKNS